MFSSSKLSEDQKTALRQWAEQGATMADLQRRLGEEHGIRLTYMETRFLVLDLGLTLHEESKAEAPNAELPKAEAADAGEDDESEEPLPGGPGAVAVTLDELAVPGAVVSGKVAFSDGHKALWYLDQMGRLGLDPDVAGYRPSREDITEFQRQLQTMLRKSGL
jgi:hypothetical protein